MSTQPDIATHLNMSTRNVRYLLKQGVRPKRGTFDEARLAYIEHLRAESGRYGSGDLTAERCRLAHAEADREEMRSAQLRDELLRRQDVDAAIVGAFSRVRQRIRPIPPKLAPVLATKTEPAAIEVEQRRVQDDALVELASTSVEDLRTSDNAKAA